MVVGCMGWVNRLFCGVICVGVYSIDVGCIGVVVVVIYKIVREFCWGDEFCGVFYVFFFFGVLFIVENVGVEWVVVLVLFV